MSLIRALARLATFKLWLYLLSGVLASWMFYLFPLLPGLVLRVVFDRLSGEATLADGPLGGWTVYGLLGLLVGIAVARVTTIFFAALAETSAQEVIKTLLRANLFEHVLGRPGARALPSSAGESISRFREDVLAIAGFVTWTLDPVGQLVAASVALVILARVDIRLTLFVVVPLMASLMLINFASQHIRRLHRASREAAGAVSGLLGEVLGATLSIKVAGAESRVIRHFEGLNSARRTAEVRDATLRAALRSVSVNAANLGVAALLFFAAGAMRDGRFSVGDFALFASYLGWLTTISGSFGFFLQTFRQTEVSFDRLTALIEGGERGEVVRHRPVHLWGDLPSPGAGAVPVSETASPDNHGHLLEGRGLTIRFPDGGLGIDSVDIQVGRGKKVVVTGPVGAGKTTLLRALLGLLPLDAGEVHWDGQRIEDPGAVLVPPRCAYTPQAPRLFSTSLRENILLGLPESDVDLDGAIRSAVLERDVAALDDGLDTLVGPRGTRLSGGQAQRAAAARMFVRSPELLVFDDLSSALDVETESVLWERLFARADVTVLAVSNRREALRRADRVIVMDGGNVVAEGQLETVLEASEVMRRLWGARE